MTTANGGVREEYTMIDETGKTRFHVKDDRFGTENIFNFAVKIPTYSPTLGVPGFPTEGFSDLVASTAASVATGWSELVPGGSGVVSR